MESRKCKCSGDKSSCVYSKGVNIAIVRTDLSPAHSPLPIFQFHLKTVNGDGVQLGISVAAYRRLGVSPACGFCVATFSSSTWRKDGFYRASGKILTFLLLMLI